MGQFGAGGLIAPLVGLARSHNAVPMGLLIGACGLSALVVNIAFSPRTAAGDAASAA